MQANLLSVCGNKWVVKSAKRSFEGGLYENGFEKKDL